MVVMPPIGAYVATTGWMAAERARKLRKDQEEREREKQHQKPEIVDPAASEDEPDPGGPLCW